MRFYIFLVLVFINVQLKAQKEGNNWYFGPWAAVAFDSGKPVALKNNAIFSRLGSSTISTPQGKLQFYSNGSSVYNSNHIAMIAKLCPNCAAAAQNSIIIPWPDSSHLYLIITPSSSNKDSVRFTIINMRLNGGLGDFEKGKLNISIPTMSSGKVSAVRHANRRDIWVVMPSGSNDSIHSYLVSSKGMAYQPVKSKTGIKINYTGGFGTDGFGYFKLSPDGTKLCDVNYLDSSYLANFDNETGIVDNVWVLNYRCFAMGAEFSPKSNYLFMPYRGKLYQYNLRTNSKAEFLGSAVLIDSSSNNGYNNACLQVAQDGKIYITEYDKAFLHSINAPDSVGVYSRIQKNAIPIFTGPSSGSVGTGLPDFIQSFFHKPSFNFRINCNNDSIFCSIKYKYQLDSVKWDFGDPNSGSLNYSSNKIEVIHYYKQFGKYKIRLISYHKEYTDTIYEIIVLEPLKPFIGNDTSLCKSKFLSLKPNREYATYKWSNSQKSRSIFITNPGTYYLTVSDYNGCNGTDTVNVFKPVVKADFTINDSIQCIRHNSFIFTETTKYSGGKRYKSTWILKDSVFSFDTIVAIKLNSVDTYLIKLISESLMGCSDSITKIVSVKPMSFANFQINDSVQCFNEQFFDFVASKDINNLSYQWDLGDGLTQFGDKVNNKKYTDSGKYLIQLITKTNNGCQDTQSKYIQVTESPNAEFIWDAPCSNSPTNFKYLGSKPYKHIIWNFNNEAFSTKEDPSYKFAKAGRVKTTLSIIFNNGCVDSLQKDIEIKPQSKADFKVQDVCESDSAVFINNSTNSTSYLWKFGDGNLLTTPFSVSTIKHKFIISSSTTFNVTLVAVIKDGCSDSITKAVSVNANPSSDFDFLLSGNIVDLKVVKAGNFYQWKFGTTDSFKTNATSHTHTINSADQIKICLIASDISGCSSQTCKSISLGIKLNSKYSLFKMYPNPNLGKFTIEMNYPEEDFEITVSDLLGKFVESNFVKIESNKYTISVPEIPGVYILTVRCSKSSVKHKFVINYK